MNAWWRLAAVAAISGVAVPGMAQQGRPVAGMATGNQAAPVTDAREQAPAGLIGYWKADLAASTYEGAKPEAAIRSFAYTAEGRILVSFATLNAAGKLTFGHWAAQVDGTPAVEYHSSAGGVAYNVVALKKLDDHRLALTVSRHGAVDIEATYELAADGQTLTYRYGGNSIVYRPWNLRD